MNTPVFLAMEITLPLVFLIVYGRMTRHRRLVKRGTPESSFEASSPPALEQFLARRLSSLSLPQQAYLAEQLRNLPVYLLVATYLLTCFFTSGLLPWSVSRFGSYQPVAQRAWYSFLEDFTFVLPMWFLGLITAVIVTTKFTLASSAVLYRTRPLSLRYLYWVRLVPKLLALLGALLLSMMLAFAFLLLFYGPVWRHLSGGPFHLSPTQLQHLIAVLHTSAPRLLLSVLTTTLLGFSLIVAAILQPFQTGPAGRLSQVLVGVSFAGMFLLQGFGMFDRLALPGRLSKLLFFYPTLGPPPPLINLLVPVALSATLLVLAAWFFARRDV